ncbi:MAG: hypothetical protein IKR22_05360 [Clostridiales bacterium]|nr:hypothetical protein [Clostridiales bacterium]
MDMNELIAQYPAIAEKAAQLGKIKESRFNKKAYARSIDEWNSFFPEELQKLNEEFANAEIVMKKAVFTPTAVCYLDLSCFHCIPVRDIIWVYAYVIKESMNFIPTGKIHQIRVIDRSGEMHIVATQNTGPFTKKTPATDEIAKLKAMIDPVRPGVIYGYSKEIEQFVFGNLPAACEKVDNASQAQQ